MTGESSAQGPVDELRGRTPTAEADVQGDPARVDSREEGGDPDRRVNEGGTTGTSVNGSFVGRVAGDDDFSGETGAEVRARQG